MPFPTKGKQADHRSFMLDAIALGRRSHTLEVPAPPTLEPSDSYDPIVHLDWQTHAACRDMGSDLFFLIFGDAIAYATRIWARCPVAEECRATALDDPSPYGIWAGTSVRERCRLRSEEGPGYVPHADGRPGRAIGARLLDLGGPGLSPS